MSINYKIEWHSSNGAKQQTFIRVGFWKLNTLEVMFACSRGLPFPYVQPKNVKCARLSSAVLSLCHTGMINHSIVSFAMIYGVRFDGINRIICSVGLRTDQFDWHLFEAWQKWNHSESFANKLEKYFVTFFKSKPTIYLKNNPHILSIRTAHKLVIEFSSIKQIKQKIWPKLIQKFSSTSYMSK